ncbi:RHS repeat domain-containing protein, partial [Effusibacillus consociatus]
VAPDGKVLFQQKHEYDSAGNVVKTAQKDDDGEHVKEFSYDPLDQLVKVVEDRKKTRTYTYDPVGNRLSKEEMELTGEGEKRSSTTYAYNAINRLMSMTEDGKTRQFAYDPVGNLSKIFTMENGEEKIFSSYQFDAANRLVEVVNQKQEKTLYAYDGDGNRISMAVELVGLKNPGKGEKGNNGQHKGWDKDGDPTTPGNSSN